MRFLDAPKKVLLRAWQSPGGIFFRKCINTFRPTAALLGKLQGGCAIREQDAAIWRHQDYYKKGFYAEIDPVGRTFIDYVADTAQKDDKILDLCCNEGRFLLDLRRKGFTGLYGVDVMGPAIETLKQSAEYDPRAMHVEHGLVQDYFRDKPDDSFDWAITYSATFELLHPEFDLFGELQRTVRKGMVLVVNEGGHHYPRFYRYLHRKHGFKIVRTRHLPHGLVLIHSVKRQLQS